MRLRLPAALRCLIARLLVRGAASGRRREPPRLLALIALVLLAASCREPRAASVLVATTTSVDNTGLLEALRGAFRERAGTDLDAFVVGSGRAIRMARSGQVDIAITHEPRGEAELHASGRAVAHRAFLENRFLLVGPRENPAGIETGMTVLAAMRRVHERRARFVSRGDESGTHTRELELWRILGLDPLANPEYRQLGQGMSALLRSANELRAYALTDEATYARFAGSLDLAPVAMAGDGLRNVYTITLVRRPDGRVNHSAAFFYEWLASPEGIGVIDRFVAEHPGFHLP